MRQTCAKPSESVKTDYFTPDMQAFLRLLWVHDVRYLVIGGLAVVYHGYARLTGDVDFFYDTEVDNADRLWNALVEFWDGSVPGIDRATELQDPNVVIQFGRPPNRIDLIAGLDAVAFGVAWGRRVTETLNLGSEQVPVHFIGLQDLIASKRAAGRPKDLDDLEHLEDSE